MVFWATVLVFIISILTYSFYPRNDQYTQDIMRAESGVLSFVNQHQAAKDYMVQMLQVSAGDTTDEGDNVMTPLPGAPLIAMMPHGSTYEFFGNINETPDMQRNQNSDDGYTSVVACYNDDADNLTSNCVDADHQYIITYGLEPLWWADNVQRRETWRKAILKRTRGSAVCGSLVGPFSDGIQQYYSIDTTQRLTGGQRKTFGDLNQQRTIGVVPLPVSNKLATLFEGGLNDYEILFCMSPFDNPYVQDNLVFHWDKINNNITGHQAGASNLLAGSWFGSAPDMAEVSVSSTQFTISGVVTLPSTIQSIGVLTDANAQSFMILERVTSLENEQHSYLKIGKRCVEVPNKIFSFTYVQNGSDTSDAILYINGKATTDLTSCPIEEDTLSQPNFSKSRLISEGNLSELTNTLANFKIYNSALTEEERSKNLKTDKKRFGIKF